MGKTTVLYDTDQPLGTVLETAKQERGQYGQGNTFFVWSLIVVGVLMIVGAFFGLNSNARDKIAFIGIGLSFLLAAIPASRLNHSAKPLFLAVHENGIELRSSDRVPRQVARAWPLWSDSTTEARFAWSDVVAYHSTDSTPSLVLRDNSLFLSYEAGCDPFATGAALALASVADRGGIHVFSFLLRPRNGETQPVAVQWITVTVHKEEPVPIAATLAQRFASLPSAHAPNVTT